MKSLNIGVLYGGKSQERQGSLKTGEAVIESLRRKNYEVFPIDPKYDNLIEKLKGIDCAFIALHGWYGEDGKIQGLLECLDIPYTGCGVMASSIGMNKILFKKLLISDGIPTPEYILFNDNNSDISNITKTLGYPIVLKPISGGGSLGVAICINYSTLIESIEETNKQFCEFFFEKYIEGAFLTIGVLGKYKRPEVLPIMEVSHKGLFYDYYLKHTSGVTEYIIPANIPMKICDEAKEYARKIYLSLGCIGPVRIDFIYSISNTSLYVLEINTSPGLSKIGNFPAIARAAKIEYDDLIELILESAFDRPGYIS